MKELSKYYVQSGTIKIATVNLSNTGNKSFLYKLLLADRKVSNLCKPFLNNSATNVKFSRTQMFKIIQLGGFLGKLLGPLLKTEKFQTKFDLAVFIQEIIY